MEPASKGTVSTLRNQNPQMLSFLSENDITLSTAWFFRCIRESIRSSNILAYSIYRWLSGQWACVFKNKSSTNKKADNSETRTAWGTDFSKVDEYHLSCSSAFD